MSRIRTPHPDPDREANKRLVRRGVIFGGALAVGAAAVSLIMRDDTAHQAMSASKPGAGSGDGAGDGAGADAGNNKIMDPEAASKGVDRMRKHGEVVFDEANGKPARVFLGVKQMHAGRGVINMLLNGKFEDFFRHQETIRVALEEELRVLGPDNVRFLIEGFAGPSSEWGTDVTSMFESLNKVAPVLTSNPASVGIYKEEAMSAAKAGDSMRAVGALRALNGSHRFAASVWQKGLGRILFGADQKNVANLSTLLNQRLSELARRDDVTDSELEEFARWAKEQAARDTKERHNLITSILAKNVPAGGEGVVVLGAGHFHHGINLSKPPLNEALETQLIGLPNTRVAVVDPHALDNLLKTDIEIVGPSNMTPTNLRKVLRAMRAGLL